MQNRISKTFSVIYAETINRKTFSVNVLCVYCIIGFLSKKIFKFNLHYTDLQYRPFTTNIFRTYYERSNNYFF
jgi:hypothetical protein